MFVCDERCEDLINHAPEVSVVGAPLFTDDDRRELSALYHQDLQGGNSKSKHSYGEEPVLGHRRMVGPIS